MSSSWLANDTIVAIATPPGEGGIGILRLSGPRAPEVVQQVYRGGQEVADFQSHRLYAGRFLHPQSEEVLDHGLTVWMRAPRSYTGEEVIELHAHGGPLILNQLLEVFLAQGLRLAEPGEFTRRAFLNGKLDLLQAEAVGEMIHAKSEAALRNAKAQLSGRISGEIQGMRERVIKLLSRVEAAIDFPEEDIEILSPLEMRTEVEALRGALQSWLDKFQLGRLLREGVRLALIGRPNVGKSSLLNRLLGEDRAIVHERPGTTRDVVEGWMSLKGVGFQVFDTAGIRQTLGEVEREGIRRSRSTADQADLVLWLLDASAPLTEEDRAIAAALPPKVLTVGNKMDRGIFQRRFPEPWQFPAPMLEKDWLLISAKTGEGLEPLKDRILMEVGLGALGERSHAYLNNARHREALSAGLQGLKRAELALLECLPAECLAADLRLAANALGALLGEVTTEEILDRIFSDFCIGK